MRVWERVCAIVCVCCYCRLILDTQTRLINYHKSARGVNCDTQIHSHTEATYTLYTHTPVLNERKKVRAHPFRALNFKKRKSKQMAKLAHKQTGPPACVWVGQLYVDQCCAALVVPLFFSQHCWFLDWSILPFSPTRSEYFHTIFCLLSALLIINLSFHRTHITFFMPFAI